MPKYIHNKTLSEKTYQGRSYPPNSFVEIPLREYLKYAENDTLVQDIIKGDVSLSRDGVSDIQGVSNQMLFLLGEDLEVRDADDALMTRVKMAPLGWTYHGHSWDVVTSQLGSLYDKKVDGSDWGWVTVKYYNANNEEIVTQSAADTDCVKTIIDWEPNIDFELIGGEVRCDSVPSGDVRLWVTGAPDIPAQNGGSKEIISGINLRMIEAKTPIKTDGRVSKRMVYNPTLHTGKIRFTIKHEAGLKQRMLFIIEGYKQ